MLSSVVSSLGSLESLPSLDLWPLADIFVPTKPDAPDVITDPAGRIVALVKWIVLAFILVGGIVSVAGAANARNRNEPAITHFSGMALAAAAAVVVVFAEDILNFIAV